MKTTTLEQKDKLTFTAKQLEEWRSIIIINSLTCFADRLKSDLKTDLTGCFTSQKQCDEWNKDTNLTIDKRLNIVLENLK